MGSVASGRYFYFTRFSTQDPESDAREPESDAQDPDSDADSCIDSLLCQRRASHHCLHFLSDIFGGFECDAFSRISKKNFGAQFFWSISWPASIWQSRLFSHSFFTDKIVENLEHWLALRCVSCLCLALLQPGKKGRKKKLDLLLLFM
jgi:hypothetical protein